MKTNIKVKIKKAVNSKFVKNVLTYSFLYLFLAFILVCIYKINGKNFIVSIDGYRQHMITLYSFRSILLEFIKNGTLNTFSWNIGLGMDLFANYAYYIIGDFFSYLSILVPESYVFTFFSILVIIRLYFVGITFLIYCHYHKKNNIYSVLGALMYTFCSYNLTMAVKHTYFITIVVLLPIVLLALERAVKEEKYIFYTIMIAVLFVASFYFGFIFSIIIAIYGVLLVIYNDLDNYKKDLFKNRLLRIIKKLFKILGYSLLGIGITSIILFPTLVQFFNSERSEVSIISAYSITYYRNFLNNLINSSYTGYDTIYGVQSIVLITLPLFIIRHKKDYPKFWLLIILLFPLLIAPIASIFDGFSYPWNRWVFIVPFILSYITVIVLQDLKSLERKDLLAIAIFFALFLITDFIFDISLNKFIVFELAIFIILFLLLYFKEKFKLRVLLFNTIFISIFTIGIAFTIVYRNDVFGDNFVNDHISSDAFQDLLSNSNNLIEGFDEAIEYIKTVDHDYYRIEKYQDAFENIPLYYDYNSIGSYYSISPSYVSALVNDLSNASYGLSFGLKDFDYRTKILSLLGVKYIISTDENYVPYGYTLLEDYDGSASIYVNENSTSFATLYTSYISTEDYKELSSLEKETILLEQNALDETVIETYDLEVSGVNGTSETITSLDYEITDTYDILEDNTITITSTSKNKITLTIEDYEDSEIYVSIKGLSYEPYSKEEMINNSLTEESSKYDIRKVTYNYKWYQESYAYTVTVNSNSVKKSISTTDYNTSAYYVEHEEMLFNFGYNNCNGTITITLNNTGTYTFDSIEVYAVSMDGYEEDVAALNESNFEVVEYDDNYMIASVNPTNDGVLQFATYYNDGWDVYVDGEKVDTFESNTYFLGIYITEGEHTIELRYHTPYVKEGFIVSGICIVATVGIYIISKKRRRNINVKIK